MEMSLNDLRIISVWQSLEPLSVAGGKNKYSLPSIHQKIPREHPLKMDETPVATIISICFVIVCLVIIGILKIVYSTDHTTGLNKYDLILFMKPSNKNNSMLVARKIFVNNAAMQHNIKALAESDFDMDSLERPKSLSMMRRTLIGPYSFLNHPVK